MSFFGNRYAAHLECLGQGILSARNLVGKLWLCFPTTLQCLESFAYFGVQVSFWLSNGHMNGLSSQKCSVCVVKWC